MSQVWQADTAPSHRGNWHLFARMLRPYRCPLTGAAVAMVLDAALTVLRPWPLKIVIDRVISHKPKGVSWLGEAKKRKISSSSLTDLLA